MFFTAFGLIFGQVLTLFILILCGFVLAKTGILKEEANRSLSALCLYFVMPLVIALSFFGTALAPRGEMLALMKNLLLCLAVFTAVHIVMILLAKAIFCRAPEGKKNILKLAATYTNCAFFCLPVVQALSDSYEGTLYVAVYLTAFNVLYWTHGVKLLDPGGKTDAKRIFLNPGVIGVGIGLIFVALALIGVNLAAFTKTRAGEIIMTSANYISALNTPLPMLLIGFSLSKTDFSAALKDGWAHLCVIVRMVVFPFLCFGIFVLCGMRGLMLSAAVCLVGAPTSSSAVMLSERYGQNTELTVRTVSVSMILSLITIPLLLALAQGI